MDVLPLGTASAIPARDRHFSALVLEREGRVLLFDCGEGTQFQLVQAGVKASRLEAVFITHTHGDHLYGLPGLLATLSLLEYGGRLRVVGPPGIRAMIDAMPSLSVEWLTYELDVCELEPGFDRDGALAVHEADDYVVTARELEHSTFAVGYRFEERARPGHLDVERARALGVTDHRHYRALKAGEAVVVDGRRVEPAEVVGPERPGRVFAYVTDTRPCEGGRALARGADLLYHEATFTAEHAERAVETGHSTAEEAAAVARDAGARRLLLGHFSARYDDPAPLEAEARRVFPDAEAAVELKRYVLAPRDIPPR